MTRHSGETWLFRVQLPDGLPNPARYMAAVLKHLLRGWGVKATAIIEAPPSENQGDADNSDAATPDRRIEA